MKKILFLLLITLSGCYSAGTLGGFEEIKFPVSKQRLTMAIDTFYSHNPEYKIREDWESLNNWSASGYDFLDSRIFYFDSEPQEMYYVTFIGDGNDKIQIDTSSVSISIRAVSRGGPKWFLREDFSKTEEKRVQGRFKNEIITKLEVLTDSKSTEGE